MNGVHEQSPGPHDLEFSSRQLGCLPRARAWTMQGDHVAPAQYVELRTTPYPQLRLGVRDGPRRGVAHLHAEAVEGNPGDFPPYPAEADDTQTLSGQSAAHGPRRGAGSRRGADG